MAMDPVKALDDPLFWFATLPIAILLPALTVALNADVPISMSSASVPLVN